MPFGWSGQILRVDLSEMEIRKEDTEPYTRSFIGGRGINTKIVYDEVSPEISPSDPANRLCFGPGVLTGTLAPSTGRMKVTSVSPNGLMAHSGIGGFIGAAIRHAGYDSLVLEGKADRPVYVYIHDDSVEFRDAGHLWGKGTQETQRLIKEETGNSVEIMCIGPGGENLVSFAGIVTGMGSMAGRHGFGAIMGSKNVKAVAVRGTGEIKIARAKEFIVACEEAHRWLRESPGMQRQAVEGAGDKYTLGSGLEEDCLGNWEIEDASWDQVGSFEGAEEFWDQYAIHQYGCFGCPVDHFHIFHIPGIGTGATKCMGWGGFTSNVWVNDRKVMFHANYLCNDYGLDVTAAGNAVSFLMELHHRGIITEKDTDGIPMARGDEKAIVSAIHGIGNQEGFGKLFRNGVLDAANKIGKEAEECAMVAKGSEIEQYEFRAFKSMALTAAMNAGSVAEGISIEYAILGDQEAIEEWARDYYGSKDIAVPTSYEKKAVTVWDGENRGTAADLLGMCKWLAWCVTPSLARPTELFSLATGQDTSEDDLLFSAQRVKALERAFNVRRGVSRADDTLPRRLLETAVPDGGFKGERLPREEFDRMLDEYYALRGWDEDGIPTEDTFRKFGLLSEWEVLKRELAEQEKPSEEAVADG
jgi:aldehyde:ferredoxin oxidoreductase